MEIFEMILKLLGGLALFLYGMNMMSSNLEAVAGNRMKKLIDKLTTNPVLGVAVGAAITAVIQSSSATTVMVVGFVNSKLMKLKQAVWVIMGANIGTTVTGSRMVSAPLGQIQQNRVSARRNSLPHRGPLLQSNLYLPRV